MNFPDYKIPLRSHTRPVASGTTISVNSRHELYNEPLLPLQDYQIAYDCIHAKTDGTNPPYYCAIPGSQRAVFLRRSVAKMLADVNKLLRPFNCELLVLDGYHSIACHSGLWNFYWQQAKQLQPDASAEQCFKHASIYCRDPNVFDPANPATWPSHVTGAAIDLTLRNLMTGELFDMGSRFEEIAPVSCSDYFENLLNNNAISQDTPQLINRRMLHWAMEQVGFCNDPSVFWHFDWGNPLYARNSSRYYANPISSVWYGCIPEFVTESLVASV